MSDDTSKKLTDFQAAQNANTKGPLALLIQITHAAQAKTFPLDSDDFLTENKGQVSGLGGSNLKKILGEHGISQILASEGGRTSRGNMGLMLKYIDFLNAWHTEGSLDLKLIEDFWADQIRGYFSNQPFVLVSDTSQTVASNLEDLFGQAQKRQHQNPGTQYAGAILQHLVAAKLSLVLPEGAFEIHGAFVADSPTNRSGDFVIGATIIHCTTAPGEPLIKKCKANLDAGCLPIIITIYDRTKTAYDLASDAGLSGRIEIWDIQQFLSTNINEHGLFDAEKKNTMLADIIAKYNAIIEEAETDPSLRIEYEARK